MEIRTINHRARRLGAASLVLALALAAPAGAEPRMTEPGPPASRSAGAQEPGIYPVLFVTDETGTGATVELHLKRVEVADRIASYQGELVYDPAALTVSAGRIPAGITGSWNETRRGTLRFAGVAVGGIEAGPVLSLTVATARPLAAEAFRLRVEEVFSAAGFQNLAPRLRQDGAHPALTRVRP